MEDYVTAVCPFCAQSFSVDVDVAGGGDQVFITDCEVCCRPVRVHLSVDAEGEVFCEVDGDV